MIKYTMTSEKEPIEGPQPRHYGLLRGTDPDDVGNYDEVVVFVSNTGSAYHNESECPRLTIAETVDEVTKRDALKEGYTECFTCQI